jgi:hypothetical protein
MAQSAGVQDVLNESYMLGRTSNFYTFGGSGYVAAGANPAAQFVGSFRGGPSLRATEMEDAYREWQRQGSPERDKKSVAKKM